MNEYNPKSCNALEKAFYTPLEAAIRWCNLISHEEFIIRAVGDASIPSVGQFPQWGCLRANTEKIVDAINHGNIPYGRDGKTVPTGEHVAPARRTVRHSDLRKWMAEHYPDQKPAFLFDEIERKTHAAFNVDSFLALQAESKANLLNFEKMTSQLNEVSSKYYALVGERDSLKAMIDKQFATPSERSETTYLNIIGGLLELLLGESPSGKPYSSFETQDAIIEAMLAYNEDKQGISKRTLQEKFAAAKRNLVSS